MRGVLILTALAWKCPHLEPNKCGGNLLFEKEQTPEYKKISPNYSVDARYPDCLPCDAWVQGSLPIANQAHTGALWRVADFIPCLWACTGPCQKIQFQNFANHGNIQQHNVKLVSWHGKPPDDNRAKQNKANAVLVSGPAQDCRKVWGENQVWPDSFQSHFGLTACVFSPTKGGPYRDGDKGKGRPKAVHDGQCCNRTCTAS